MIKIRNDVPIRTALERTAFAILGATSRDSRRRIVELGEENSEAGKIKAWIADYLRQRTTFDSIEEAHESKSPFRRDGHRYLFSGDLRLWLSLREREKIELHELARRLRVGGAVPETIGLLVEGKKTTRSAWRLPSADIE